MLRYGLALFLMLSCSVMAMRAGTESLRIMTYNVPRNNEHIEPVGVNTLDMRFAALAELVNKVRPDVLGMQEPTNADLWMFLKNLDGYAMIGVGREDGMERGQYTLILYRTDKFYVEKHGFYFLSKTPEVMGSKDWGSSCSRLATWGIFRDKVTKARFLYTNTHLDHISDSARTNQMRVIKEHMRALVAENGTMPMMITGDFNVSQTTQGAYVNATTLHIPMNDAWLVAEKQEGLKYSFPAHDYGTKRKLDYIILSKDIEVKKAYIGNSVQTNGTIISDHNPHWADITWKTTPSEDTEALIQAAREACDSTLVYISGNDGLIVNATEGTDGCQVSYDTQEPTGGALANLIDGNDATYFRSSWSTVNPYQPHYFQVDLCKTYRNIHFDYARLAGTSSTATGNCWKDVLVTASNDGVGWDYITEFCDVPTAEGLHKLPTIRMRRPYRYIRFSALRTPDMKIRTSFVQYVVGEFQLYEDRIDTLKSQRFFNQEVKAACDVVVALTDEVETAYNAGTVTEIQLQQLEQALQDLRSVKIDKTPLRDMLLEVADLLTTFGYGTKFGQGSKEAYDELKVMADACNAQMENMDTKSKVDEACRRLKTAKEAYMATRKTFQTGKWYYIQCYHLANMIKQKEYGQALYADGNGSKAMLKNGYFVMKRNKLECLQNPYAMWRIVSQGDGAYALQNRATGFFLGEPTADGSSLQMSPTPVSYCIDMLGVEDFHISASDSEQGQAYVTAVADGSVNTSDGGYHSAAAWIFTEVDDASVGQVLIPVKNHHIDIMTLPFAFENANADIHTYTLVGMPSNGVFNLKKQDSFAAGEPFFIMTGTIGELDADCEEMTYLPVVPPEEFVATPLSVNGVCGLLDEGMMPKVGYCVQKNKLKMTRIALPANSGYILRNDVAMVGNDYDMTLSTSGVAGVKSPVIWDKETVDVYGIDGRCCLRGVRPASIKSLLPKGIYIVGDKKIVVP